MNKDSICNSIYSILNVDNKAVFDPTFWIDRVEEASSVLMEPVEIGNLNHKIASRMQEQQLENYYFNFKSTYFLEKERKVKKDLFVKEMEKINTLQNLMELSPKNFYTSSGSTINTLNRESLSKFLLNFENYKKKLPAYIQTGFGFTTKKCSVKSLPMAKKISNSPNFPFQDLLALTTLSPGEPILVYQKCFDSRWYFVQSYFYSGWIKVDDFITVSRETFINYLSSDSFLVVTESKIETEDLAHFSKLKFQMGDKIILATEIETQRFYSKLGYCFPEGCFPLKIPFDRSVDKSLKSEDGFAVYPLSGSKEVKRDFLAFTRENIIKQAFKMLGERYGWGGSNDNRDCSRFIMDIFKTFGLYLPRDSKYQETMVFSSSFQFSSDISERKTILDKLLAGDLLFMKGHVMMYLGKLKDKYYVIHQGSGFRIKDDNGVFKIYDIHGTFVMDLSSYSMNSNLTYLESLSSAITFKGVKFI